MCTRDGIQVEIPEYWQMVVTNEKANVTHTLPTVYWLGLLEDHLNKDFVEWKPWIQQIKPDLAKVKDLLHCNLYYDSANEDEAYGEAWADLMEGRFLNVMTENFINVPQWVAATALLSDMEEPWYKVKNKVPHVSLMVSSEYEGKDLGPMIKLAEKVEWVPNSYSKIFASRDGTYVKVETRTVWKTIAEKVLTELWGKQQNVC